jgi:NADH:ubiquinone oxidoreductase subunit C
MNEKFTKIFNSISGALLESARFGRSEDTAHWVNGGQLKELSKRLHQEGCLTWVENLSCIQVDKSLVLTYFLRGEHSEDILILRVSVDLPESTLSKAHQREVDVPSVSETWASAKEFESEISNLFGVRFTGGEETKKEKMQWNGFPLRKDFVFSDVERAGGFDE